MSHDVIEQGHACSVNLPISLSLSVSALSFSSFLCLSTGKTSIPVSVRDLYELVSVNYLFVRVCVRVCACVPSIHDTGILCNTLNHLYSPVFRVVEQLTHGMRKGPQGTQISILMHDTGTCFQEECMFVFKNAFMHTVS